LKYVKTAGSGNVVDRGNLPGLSSMDLFAAATIGVVSLGKRREQ